MKIRLLRDLYDIEVDYNNFDDKGRVKIKSKKLIAKKGDILECPPRKEKEDWLVGCPVVEIDVNGYKETLGEKYDFEEFK